MYCKSKYIEIAQHQKRSEMMIQFDSIRAMLPQLRDTLKEIGDSL